MKTTIISSTDEYLILWHLGFALIVKASAKLTIEGLCSWPSENRSLALKKGREPRLRNSDVECINDDKVLK